MKKLLHYYYSRYGLADVLLNEFDASRKTALDIFESLTEKEFEEAAIRRLNALKQHIRLQFPVDGLEPRAEIQGNLVHEPDGTPEKQVSEKGFYIRPHVLLDAGALNGRYGLLNSYIPTKKKVLQRFYPPATKLSLGKKSADNMKAPTAFVLACQVTTLTTLKAARKSGDSDRSAVIPDIPLPEMVTFINVLDFMQQKSTNPLAATVRKSGEGVNLHDNRGNFPEAPPEWAFGGLGVIAAIGTWGRRNNRVSIARPTIDALADERFYIIDTSGQSRVETPGSHLPRLATNYNLARILHSAWKVNTASQKEDFYRPFRRWLLLFDEPTFHNFMAVRAQYPPEFAPLFEAYFMSRHDPELIESARIAGQHVSTQAWHAAEGSDIEAKRKNTQTILASLESMLRDCSNGPEMLARLSVQVGRLTGSSFPAEAQLFFDRVAEDHPEKLNLKDARNLLLSYMRLRKPSQKKDAAEDGHPPETEPEDTAAAQEMQQMDAL